MKIPWLQHKDGCVCDDDPEPRKQSTKASMTGKGDEALHVLVVPGCGRGDADAEGRDTEEEERGRF